MKSNKLLVRCALGLLVPFAAQAWDAKVTHDLQHGGQIAIYLSPDPGPISCSVGQPYLVNVDESTASKQRFAMIMLAVATGQSISGYDDRCSSGIWAVSRPLVVRLTLAAP
jgi:hypothetical protein